MGLGSRSLEHEVVGLEVVGLDARFKSHLTPDLPYLLWHSCKFFKLFATTAAGHMVDDSAI